MTLRGKWEERKELTGRGGEGGGSATSTWRHTGSLNKNKLDKLEMRWLCLTNGTIVTFARLVTYDI